MKSSRRTAVVFLIVGVVLVSTITTIYWIGQRVLRMNEEILTYRDTIEHLDGLLSTMKDAETGERGYLITGRQEFLEPYDAALARMHQEVDRLRQTELHGNSVALRGSVIDLIGKRLAELKRIIALRQKSGFQAAERRWERATEKSSWIPFAIRLGQ
jgi:CHASE3 domain sensor protein